MLATVRRQQGVQAAHAMWKASAENGRPLRQIVEGMAGAERGRTVAIVAGGPSGGLIPERLLDLPLRPGTLDDGGAIQAHHVSEAIQYRSLDRLAL